jgi:hypothetical protein
VLQSWSDPGAAKYVALNKWAIKFHLLRRRNPNLWLEYARLSEPTLLAACVASRSFAPARIPRSSKACIKQGSDTSISEQLTCLPVFLAGCKEVLVLAGPTFTERLWVRAAVLHPRVRRAQPIRRLVC